MRRVRSKLSPNQPPMAMPPAAAGNTAATVAMIQALIPLELRAVDDALLAEVATLVGLLYARADAQPVVVH